MLVGRPHVHASGEPLLMGTIGTYLQVHLAVVLTLTALISACATCLQRASECSPLSAGALTSACAACTSEMSFHLVSAGPIVCRCTLSVSFTLATTLGQSMTPACVPLALQVHPGVFLTLSRRLDGQNQLTRIRFSRQQFSKDTAEEWWQEHKQEIAMRCAACAALQTP